jgi:hypothetical protein
MCESHNISKTIWVQATCRCRLTSENYIKFKLPQLLHSDSDRQACRCEVEHMMIDLQYAGSIMNSNKKKQSDMELQ